MNEMFLILFLSKDTKKGVLKIDLDVHFLHEMELIHCTFHSAICAIKMLLFC